MRWGTHGMQLGLGLAIWSLWFVALYGGLSVVCSVAPPAVEAGPYNWLNGSLLLLTLAAIVLLVWLAFVCWRAARAAGSRERRFLARIGAAVHVVGAAAVLLVGFPVFAYPPCV